MIRRLAGVLIAIGALAFTFDTTTADASAAAKTHHSHSAKSSHKTVKAKKAKASRSAARKAKRGKVAATKFKPVSPASLVVTVKEPNNAPDFDFTDRIQEAQELARKAPVLPGDMVVDANNNLARFTWVLVVGERTGPLTVLRMDERGNNDQRYVVTYAVNNFLNTKFTVSNAALPAGGLIVFAQRRPVRANGGWEQAVYTAYSPDLDTAKMRKAGLDYLQQLEHQAYNHLQSHDVRSRAVPRDTVADQIPRSMVLRLMITEHIDPLHMKFVGVEQCIHEVLITVAANREKSYAYARSSAGALGISQFIEDSYQMVRENYPAARLEPNFDIGMRNMRNAVIASILHMDLELAHLPADYLKRFTDSAYHLGAFLAAGYNRNPVNVVRTYKKTRTFTGGDVSFENKMYVRVQDWVGGWLKRTYDISDSSAPGRRAGDPRGGGRT